MRPSRVYMSVPFRSLIRLIVPSGPGSSIQANRHAPTNFSLAEMSSADCFGVDCANTRPLTPRTTASAHTSRAFRLDSSSLMTPS